MGKERVRPPAVRPERRGSSAGDNQPRRKA